ncbi:MAG: NAD(P)/FAD-dependent oxidoreductase [Spirochaetales bacterium]|nr:NAD(P)/FAD-dependent oxidoreductase [Spirochaetales bacterium]
MKSVVIIGAGLGGLTAGCLLAKKGHKVTIFESHSSPGGYTAGFWRKGFYFESGTLAFESSNLISPAMKEIGIYQDLDFKRHHMRVLYKDTELAMDSFDGFRESLLRAFPGEKENILAYFEEAGKMYKAMQPLIVEGSKSLLSIFSKLSAGIKMAGIYKKYSKMTVDEFTTVYFKEGTPINLIFRNMGYPGMSAYIVGGMYATMFDDYWIVAQGMQHWADKLAEKFVSLGGTLTCKSLVEKIITDQGKAVGVEYNGKFQAADFVIAAGDYKKTFLKLLDNTNLLPAEQLEKIKTNAVSEGIFTVYLGLSLPNGKLKEIMKLHLVSIFNDLPGLASISANDPDYFTKAGVSLYSPSFEKPDLAPEGKSSLMIQSVAPNGWMNNWGGGDASEYKKLKQKTMEALIDKAALLIPDIRKLIEYQDAATPLTYEKFTHNTNGATSAWSWNPNNKFYDNIMKTYVITPVKNLYIGSCWSNQIGGVPGAVSAALKCVKLIK